MKGGPTVVQGTPVGQADMTVPRSFTSGLCDCCNDGKTCLAVWCCAPITTAQLWQYTFGQPGSCLVISVVLFALVGVGQLLNLKIQGEVLEACGPAPRYTPETRDAYHYYTFVCAPNVEPALSQIASYTSAVLFAAVFFFTCQVRGAIRKRDQIPGSCCGGGGCEDCCYSWFCSCCTQAQIMRHVGMKADNYNLCAPGGMV